MITKIQMFKLLMAKSIFQYESAHKRKLESLLKKNKTSKGLYEYIINNLLRMDYSKKYVEKNFKASLGDIIELRKCVNYIYDKAIKKIKKEDK